jgi:hypothetical protein
MTANPSVSRRRHFVSIPGIWLSDAAFDQARTSEAYGVFQALCRKSPLKMLRAPNPTLNPDAS